MRPIQADDKASAVRGTALALSRVGSSSQPWRKRTKLNRWYSMHNSTLAGGYAATPSVIGHKTIVPPPT